MQNVAVKESGASPAADDLDYFGLLPKVDKAAGCFLPASFTHKALTGQFLSRWTFHAISINSVASVAVVKQRYKHNTSPLRSRFLCQSGFVFLSDLPVRSRSPDIFALDRPSRCIQQRSFFCTPFDGAERVRARCEGPRGPCFSWSDSHRSSESLFFGGEAVWSS